MYSENLAQSSKGFCGGAAVGLGSFSDEASWKSRILEFINSLTYGDIGYCWYTRTYEHIYTYHTTVFKHGHHRALIREECAAYRSYSRYWMYDEVLETDDHWVEYGYDFPPLNDSVEYCTRERDTTGSVYAYRVGIGALPNSGTKTITLPSEVLTIMDIRLIAKTSTDQFIGPGLSESGSPLVRTYLSGASTIVIQTFSNMSKYGGWLILKYRKALYSENLAIVQNTDGSVKLKNTINIYSHDTWLYPPLIVQGPTYATNMLYDGNQVYMKLVNLGAHVDGKVVEIPVTINPNEVAVPIFVSCTLGYDLLPTYTSANKADVSLNAWSSPTPGTPISVEVVGQSSTHIANGSTLWCWVWYYMWST